MPKKDLLLEIARLTKILLGLQAQQELEDLRPLVKRKQAELISLATKAGFPIRATSGFRSANEQNALYAQGRTKPGPIVTNAKGGQSLHNHGVAFDVCFISKTPYDGPWEELGKLGESIGLEWGGRWPAFVDKPHFQLMFNYTLKDFQEKKVDISKYK